jgi:Leucine-rich repeat (LRR) protein
LSPVSIGAGASKEVLLNFAKEEGKKIEDTLVLTDTDRLYLYKYNLSLIIHTENERRKEEKAEEEAEEEAEAEAEEAEEAEEKKIDADTSLEQKIFDISFLHIENIPEDIFDEEFGGMLDHIDMKNIGLIKIPDKLFEHCINLKSLGLGRNKLTELPAGFLNNCTKLKRLYLYYNELTELPAGFLDNCTQLQWQCAPNRHQSRR